MRAYACAVLLVLCVAQTPGVAGAPPDTLDRIPELDPNAAEFPDASISGRSGQMNSVEVLYVAPFGIPLRYHSPFPPNSFSAFWLNSCPARSIA